MPLSKRTAIARTLSLSKPRATTRTHRRSETTGSLSQTSSETMLSDSQSDDAKSVEETPLVASLPTSDDVSSIPAPNDLNGQDANLQSSQLPTQHSLPAAVSTRLQSEPQQRPSSPKSAAKTASSNLDLPVRTSTSVPPMTKQKSNDSRMMHQTSSKLLRMTEDDRPFTRDIKDLFSTLIVSLPLIPHRVGVRFSKVDHTFSTEEAVTNLGSLKFSQSNRMPDPRDPNRIVTTTTTTTFSMAKEMARSVCMRFLEARFIESLDGKTDFSSSRSVWQMTPKGMHILSRFCQRNGIHQRHINEVLDSPRNMMQLVILEREERTDRLVHDAAMIEVLFRRFAGDTGPNVKSTSASSDSDSVQDYATGLMGVRMQRARRPEKNTAPYTFSGKAAFDWLMDCCTVANKEEAYELAISFMVHGFTEPVGEDRNQLNAVGERPRFIPTKHAIYAITQHGMEVAGWVRNDNGYVNTEATTSLRTPAGASRDSNTNRMTVIIRDPALRMQFREYLRETHCEENLAFYTDVQAFLADYDLAKRSSGGPSTDVIRETLASAYSLYNAFLAPGSPCELNIDHSLRNSLAGRMTRAVGEDEQMLDSLDEVAGLFYKAQTTVFKLMASDSVPKFSREPKYASMLRERNLEGMIAVASL